eukprot:TRINITY_DN14035_c0_g1_i1.p1 TRINITY_DN14035_c0_g1~~TRINITY_DN14035_c0_g1_i1.p1  ORF type:complete len:146 (-),score=40.33 TRINITY_DN14035_c0_g1_i1:531-968(-)
MVCVSGGAAARAAAAAAVMTASCSAAMEQALLLCTAVRVHDATTATWCSDSPGAPAQALRLRRLAAAASSGEATVVPLLVASGGGGPAADAAMEEAACSDGRCLKRCESAAARVVLLPLVRVCDRATAGRTLTAGLSAEHCDLII